MPARLARVPVRSTLALSVLIVSGGVLAAAPSGPPKPPETRREPFKETLHGTDLVDEYRWLEALEQDSPEVRDWTTAQLDRTRAMLDGLPCRQGLASELERLMTIGAITAPTMRGDLYIYTERNGSQNQPVLMLRHGHAGPPRALLDVNSLDGKGLTSLDWWDVSPDGKLLAFGTSVAGSEMSELQLLDVATGEWLADTIGGKVRLSSWLPDGSGFLYSGLRDAKDPYSREVRFHRVGTSPKRDPVLVAQREPSKVPFAGASRDGRWLFFGESRGWQANDLNVADFELWRRSGELKSVSLAQDLDGRFTPQAVLGDTMYLHTTFEAPNGTLLAVDLNDPRRERWTTLIPERKDAVLQAVAMARGLLVATWEKDASTRFSTHGLDGAQQGEIVLPGIGTAGISSEEDRTEAFLSFTSYNEPRVIQRLDLRQPSAREEWGRVACPVDLGDLVVEQVKATSKDGTQVPMFLVHRKDLPRDGATPTLLYGYGGFNVSMTPSFVASAIPWITSGGVFVVANLRGGGEYGEAWHRAGMLGDKQNVFDDFYACAEWLIEHRVTSPRHLAIEGGSNGGLLTGVAATQRPDLFAAVLCEVPLLDMLRYHQFLIAKYWVPEYGSSDDPKQFAWLKAYSPYHNIRAGQAYPAILFTAGENDSRVHPLHARKMTARMQALAGNDQEKQPILLWVDREAGHGQGKPLAARIREEVDQWAFVMWRTGLCGAAP